MAERELDGKCLKTIIENKIFAKLSSMSLESVAKETTKGQNAKISNERYFNLMKLSKRMVAYFTYENFVKLYNVFRN